MSAAEPSLAVSGFPGPSGPPWAGYGAGLALSVAVHVGVAVLIVGLLHPSPVTDQPAPQSQLHIETEAVTQSQATAQAAEGDKARTTAAAGTAAAQGQVIQSQARPVALPQTVAKAEAPLPQPTLPLADLPQVLAQAKTPTTPAAQAIVAAPPVTKAADVPSQSVSATPPLGQSLPQAAFPQPPALQAALPQPTLTPTVLPQQSVTAAALPAQVPIPAALPQAQSLAAVAPPTPVMVMVATASGVPVAATAPLGEAAMTASPDVQPAAVAPATGTAMTATLAWSGDGGAIDPVSLTAIAAFMQPGDAAQQADTVHDGLGTILTSVPCARLQAEFNPATGSLDLRGHVPDEALKAPLLAALQAQLGSGIKVRDAMVILPHPQCGALSGIADVGLPQSQDQLTNPRLIGADAQARIFSYTKGQAMVLDLAAPDYDAYLYVDFFDADGRVIHLVPNATVPLKLRAAKSAMRVGAPDAGEPFLHITIGPPYGQEIAAAFAASAPLYDGTRPLSEPAAAYLDWLKARVSAARAKDAGFKGEWVYFMVSTTED